jgi:hypothetical protein
MAYSAAHLRYIRGLPRGQPRVAEEVGAKAASRALLLYCPKMSDEAGADSVGWMLLPLKGILKRQVRFSLADRSCSAAEHPEEKVRMPPALALAAELI